jgi:3-deoxy-D-manno-octulosonic-acid transferase
MGEMMYYYDISDLAIVGGSFSDNGGQNLIEPLFMDIPVIFGPSMFNFTTIADNAVQSNCAIKVSNIKQVFDKVEYVFENNNDLILKQNCDKFIKKYTGASNKIVDILSSYL